MSSVNFFIDTADETYIKKLWNDFLKTGLTGKEVVGITTNPNAMFKCNIQTLPQFKDKVKILCELITSIRNDDQGIIYVQHPDSSVTLDNFKKWIDTILTFTDNHTKIGIKIPPYLPLLQLIEEYQDMIDFNVTGVADCSTALLCFTYSPRYVSLIPGRMEESGIDAVSQMLYIDQRKKTGKSELITGSMRTIAGLKFAIFCNTVPTIGTRVFDLLNVNKVTDFTDLWNFTPSQEKLKFSPHVNEAMTNLSIAFFEQMDEMGAVLKSTLYE